MVSFALIEGGISQSMKPTFPDAFDRSHKEYTLNPRF